MIRTPLAFARRIRSYVGARGIYVHRRRRRHPREKMENGVGGQTATSEARRPSSFVSDTGWTMERRERTQHTQRRRPADTRDFLHTQHTSTQHISADLVRSEPGRRRTRKDPCRGKKALPRSRIPVSPPFRRRFSAKSLPCTDPRGWGSTESRFPANGGGKSGRIGGRRRDGRAADRRCSQWRPSVVMSCVVVCWCCSGRAGG